MIRDRWRLPAVLLAVALLLGTLPPLAPGAQAQEWTGHAVITPNVVSAGHPTPLEMEVRTSDESPWDTDAQVSIREVDGATIPDAVDGVTVDGDTIAFDLVASLPIGNYAADVASGGQVYDASFSVADTSCSQDELDSGVSQDGLQIGFESGDLTGWSLGAVTDSVEVVGSDTFGGAVEGDNPVTVNPLEGEYMARLGSSYDNSGERQLIGPNEICQDFVVTDARERFAFNVVTYDWTGFDEFRYEVTVEDPATGAVIARYSQGAFGPGGNTDLKSTGWRAVELDLAGREGQTLRLNISAGGTRDELYGFWAYVDSADGADIPEVAPSPIPDPPSGSSLMINPSTGLFTLAFPGFTEDFGDVDFEIPVTCPEGQDFEEEGVRLILGVGGPEFVADEISEGGTASFTIPADAVATATEGAAGFEGVPVVLIVDCTGDSLESLPIGEVILYDPSGYITDAVTGNPIEGAEVVLYNVPGWEPKTGPDDDRADTCQSHDSKDESDPWDQPAPTDLGEREPAASNRISPNVNPFLSNDDGYYGWDVAEGCWYVEVAAEGYETLVSPVVGVPPEVTDLDLELHEPRSGPTPPSCAGVTGATFPDVDSGYTHYSAISCSAGLKLVQGKTDGNFDPRGTLTRGQLASILLRLLEASDVELDDESSTFTDIAGSTHESAIRKLAAAGIIEGRNPTTFDPQGPITRGQIMTLLDRTSTELLAPLPAASGPRFGDIAGSVHQAAIDRMAAAELARGVGDGSRFAPSDSVIRGQAAAFVTRWLDWQHDALS